MKINVEISPGELLDKIVILEIKTERINDQQKLHNIKTELQMLRFVMEKEIVFSEELLELMAMLKVYNEELWLIEDDIRECEQAKRYDQEFIDLARQIYLTNDKRSDVKRKINMLLGSKIIEEKSYTQY